jgi:hypothetical protein
MERANSKYYEKIIQLTAYPEWKDLVVELEKEIYQLQSNALDEATDFPDLCERRGFAKGLAYLVNLRADTELAMRVEGSNDAPV